MIKLKINHFYYKSLKIVKKAINLFLFLKYSRKKKQYHQKKKRKKRKKSQIKP
jgi:hypothetical protein